MGNMSAKIQDLLTPKSAQKFLNVSKMTLWRWIQCGKLEYIVVDGKNFLSKEALEKFKSNKKAAS